MVPLHIVLLLVCLPWSAYYRHCNISPSSLQSNASKKTKRRQFFTHCNWLVF